MSTALPSDSKNAFTIPKSSAVLIRLLDNVRAIIGPLLEVKRRQEFRLKATKQFMAGDSESLVEQSCQIGLLGEASRSAFREGILSIRLLLPYLPADQVGILYRQLKTAVPRLETARRRILQAPADFAASLESLIEINERVLSLLFDLQQRINVRLEYCADTNADKTKKAEIKPIENWETRELYFRLERGEAEKSELSERQYAIDFYDQDVKKADSALRAIRRQRKKVKDAEDTADSADI